MKNGELKYCAVCGREIEWRRKWARDWDAIRYCSGACRRRLGRGARPHARGVVTFASPHREPDPIHLKGAHDDVLRIVHRYVANLRPGSVCELVERCFEIVKALYLVAVDALDDGL